MCFNLLRYKSENREHANIQRSFSPTYKGHSVQLVIIVEIHSAYMAIQFSKFCFTVRLLIDQIMITNSKLNKPKFYSSTNDKFSF